MHRKTTMHGKVEPAAVTRAVFTALLLCYAASALADPSQKLFEGFAGAMFGLGPPLDALHYFLILPNSIGSGK